VTPDRVELDVVHPLADRKQKQSKHKHHKKTHAQRYIAQSSFEDSAATVEEKQTDELVENTLFAGAQSDEKTTIPMAVQMPALAGQCDPSNAGDDSILLKPLLVSTYRYTSGVQLISAPDDYLGLEVIKNRLRGFYNNLFALRLRFEVSSTPFTYGRSIVSVSPPGGPGGARDYRAHCQVPHEYIDYGTNTGCEIDLYPISQTLEAQFPTVRIVPLVPPANAMGGDAAVTINVFVSVIPGTLHRGYVTSYIAQSSFDNSADASDEQHIKPSAWLYAGSTVAAAVPSNPWVTAAGMVMGVGAQIAEMFGYSRKPVETPPTRMNARGFTLANVNDPDCFENLSFNTDAQTTIACGLGMPDVGDQMDINNLLGMPVIADVVTMNTGSATAGFVVAFPVTPMMLGANVTTGATPFTATPAHIVAGMFGYWRGTAVYTFEAVAASSHSGILEFVWDPYLVSASASGHTAYKVVLDLQGNRTVSVEVPMTGVTPYKPTIGVQMLESSSVTGDMLVPEEANGAIALYLTQAIETPSTVDSNVSIIVKVAWKDVEFYKPNPNPTVYNQSDLPVAQSTFRNGDKTPTDSQLVIPSHRYPYLPICYGDAINSLRQLLTRYVKVTENTNGNVIFTKNSLSTKHPFGLLWSCFSAFRGGYRLKVIPKSRVGSITASTWSSLEDCSSLPSTMTTGSTPLEIKVPYHSQGLFRYCSDNTFADGVYATVLPDTVGGSTDSAIWFAPDSDFTFMLWIPGELKVFTGSRATWTAA
jgi:hypothetical protein